MALSVVSLPLSAPVPPSGNVDLQGFAYTKSISADQRASMGIFYTPLPVAQRMAALIHWPTNRCNLRVLDPAAGAGILLSCVAEQWLESTQHGTLHLMAYEVDATALPLLSQSLNSIKAWASSQGRTITYQICHTDFLLIPETKHKPSFDILVANPPYGKLPVNHVLRQQSSAAPYQMAGLFMAAAKRFLKPGGQGLWLIPRILLSGMQFKGLRQNLWEKFAVTHIQICRHRDALFGRDGVLQEVVLLQLQRFPYTPPVEPIPLNVADGIEDYLAPHHSFTASRELILPANDPLHRLLLPHSPSELKCLKAMAAKPKSLFETGWKVNTGPVVPFRSTHLLENEPAMGSIPLIEMHNLSNPGLIYPHPTRQRWLSSAASAVFCQRQPQTIITRRFINKGGPIALHATPIPLQLLQQGGVAVENHLNIITRHKINRRYSPDWLIKYLNSKEVAIWLSCVCGGTQVGATELATLRCP